MKRFALLIALIIAVSFCTFSEAAESKAREAMVAYSGTEAFTRLTAEERQACTGWLVYGGTMSEECRKAVIRLVSDAPDAVTPEQRQALLAEASGTSGNTEAPQRDTARKPSSSPAPLSEDRTPTIKKSDTAGKIVAAGVAALLIGLVLHNNTKRHRNGPVYQAPPPPSAPGGRGRYDRQPLQPMRVPVQGDTRRYQPERRPPRR